MSYKSTPQFWFSKSDTHVNIVVSMLMLILMVAGLLARFMDFFLAWVALTSLFLLRQVSITLA